MSAPTIPKRPSRDEFTGDYAEDLDGLLGVIGDAQESLVTAAAGVVTPYFKTSVLKHATLTRVRSPLPKGVKCAGVYAVRSIGLTMGPDGRPVGATFVCPVANVDFRSLGPTQDGGEVLGLTVQYDLAHTQPSLEMFLSGNQSIPHNTNTAVVYGTTKFSRGSVISHAAGVFTFSEAGTYAISSWDRWEAATYTVISSSFDYAGESRGELNFQLAWTNGPYITTSAIFKIAAGGTMQHNILHVNAAAAARVVAAAAGNGTQIQINRLYNDTLPTARVTLVCYGAE